MSNPILSVGTFGTHIIAAPSGRFILVGTVPTTFRGVAWETAIEAQVAVVAWAMEHDDADKLVRP